MRHDGDEREGVGVPASGQPLYGRAAAQTCALGQVLQLQRPSGLVVRSWGESQGKIKQAIILYYLTNYSVKQGGLGQGHYQKQHRII